MKEEILKEIRDFGKEVNKYNKNIKKFKKKFPQADVYAHLSSELSKGIFIKRYGSKIEFFRTDKIFSQNNQANPLIELEKWSIHSWSSSSLTKITPKEFAKYYLEVNEDFIKEEIEKYKLKELEAIKKLKKDTLDKLKKIKEILK